MLSRVVGRLTSRKGLSFADQIISSALNFGLVVYAARALPMSEFSSFAFMLLGILLLSGLQQGLVSTPAMTLNSLLSDDEAAQYPRVVFALHAAFLLVGLACFYVFLMLGDHMGRGAGVPAHEFVGCLYLACRIHQEFCRRYNLARHRYGLTLAADSVMASLSVLGLGALVLFRQATLPNFLLILSIASLSGCWFSYRTLAARLDWSLSANLLLRHLRSGAWLSLTSLLSMFGGTLVHILAGYRLGPEAIAALRASSNLTRLTNLLVLTAENYLPQLYASRRAKGATMSEMHGGLVIGTTVKLGLAFAAFAAAYFFLSPFVLRIVYGSGFEKYRAEAAVYMLVPLLSGLTLPAAIFLRTFELSRKIFSAYVLSVITTVIVADWMLRSYGLMGAVMTLVISQLLFLLIVVLQTFLAKRASTKGVE